VAQLAAGLAAALLAVVALLVAWRGARRGIAGRDRRAEKLVEYLAMWTRDRDWQAAAAVRELARPTRAAAAEVYRQALRDYSDEAWRIRREHRGLQAGEGRLDAWLRARRGTEPRQLTLPHDCLAVLDRWRERAEHDAGHAALECRIRNPVPERRAA
jgi:hypothetical protein